MPLDKIRQNTIANWIVAAAVPLAFVGLPCVLILRLGLRLSWSELAIPLSLLALLHAALVAGTIWIRKHKSLRIAAPIFGAYYVVLFWMLAHYGSRWGLHTGFEESDVRWLAFLIVVIVLGLVLMPHRWIQHFNEIKCVSCHHFHEGRDCACGCRIDQFKYPNRTSGIP
jgi:hypothetical protein